jgi:hypothetical protein
MEELTVAKVGLDLQATVGTSPRLEEKKIT